MKREAAHSTKRRGSQSRVPTHIQKHFPYFFNTCLILNEKTLMPSFIFIFPIFYSWNVMEKTSVKLSSVVKTKLNS